MTKFLAEMFYEQTLVERKKELNRLEDINKNTVVNEELVEKLKTYFLHRVEVLRKSNPEVVECDIKFLNVDNSSYLEAIWFPLNERKW